MRSQGERLHRIPAPGCREMHLRAVHLSGFQNFANGGLQHGNRGIPRRAVKGVVRDMTKAEAIEISVGLLCSSRCLTPEGGLVCGSGEAEGR